MVVLLDLDDDVADPHLDRQGYADFGRFKDLRIVEEKVVERPNPNAEKAIARALSCYPIAIQLTSNIDLNTLDALARSCRQIRANLLEHRSQLVKHALKCSNEDVSVGTRLADMIRDSHMGLWGGRRVLDRRPVSGQGRLLSGTAGTCARDMVGECMRCGRVVCRNCTTKPPPLSHLRSRHRRLCPACSKQPLTSETPICTCPHTVYFCQPCSHTLRQEDTTYQRGWTWRTRYSAALGGLGGGLGTGVGEGSEGVECGRQGQCARAREVLKEIEVRDEEAQQALIEEGEPFEGHSAGVVERWSGGGGYLEQEIEGIGGVVKRLVRRRIRVGAPVKERRDEREGRGEALRREMEGCCRSWCGWCNRLIPSKQEEEAMVSGEWEALRRVESSGSESDVSSMTSPRLAPTS